MNEHHHAGSASAHTLAERQDKLDRQFSLGWQLFQQRRLDEAMAFYDGALAAASETSAQAYLLGHRAQSLNALGRIDEALEQTGWRCNGILPN